MTATTDNRQSTARTSQLLASFISEVFGPMPVGLALCVGVGATARGWAGAGWGLFAIVFAAVIPYIITWRMRHPQDGKKPSRRTRLRYLLVTTCCACAGLLIVAQLGAPKGVVAIAIMIVVGLLVGAVINARWRMSNHVAGASAAVTALSVIYSPVWLLGLTIVALIAWARIRLGMHTLPEVILGAIVGGAVGALIPTLLLT